VTPVQIAQFHRGQRYQILPAYSQKGILSARVFQGSTDGLFFEDFRDNRETNLASALHQITSIWKDAAA
jgi:hypothetical protein